MSALFGKRAPRYKQKDITEFFDVLHEWETIMTPGVAPPVDFLPFLKYLPARLAPWKKWSEDIKRRQRALFVGLLDETADRVANGHENGSFMEQILKRRSELGISYEQAAYLGGTMMVGGFDSTALWAQSLVLALVAFPEAQSKAQAELDQVVGRDRLPVLEDLLNLPYMQALIKESHCWRTVAPLGLPHASTEEIKYRDFVIPARTIIFINLWGMSHDPQVYECPKDFWPDRWISSESGSKRGVYDNDLREYSWFGNGRRACPGFHLANNSLGIIAMSLIWAFQFGPAINAGTEEPVPVNIFNYSAGVGFRPNPFECTIKPRTKHHAEIIKQEFIGSGEAFALYENDLEEVDRMFVKGQRE